jgi:L-rhamnose-H+ transport protein
MSPIFGVCFHWAGGFCAGSFYAPYRNVTNWSWEIYWMVGGVFSWVVCPWLLAFLLTEDLLGVLGRAEAGALLWPLFFGLLWGLGRVTFGLTMRYLGLSLGMGMALGYCAAMGTLLPPVFKLFLSAVPGLDIVQIATTLPGAVTLLGCLITLAGIGVTTKARAPTPPPPPRRRANLRPPAPASSLHHHHPSRRARPAGPD